MLAGSALSSPTAGDPAINCASLPFLYCPQEAKAAKGGKKAPAKAAKSLMMERDDDYIRGGGEYNANYDDLAENFGGAAAGDSGAAAASTAAKPEWKPVDDGDFM